MNHTLRSVIEEELQKAYERGVQDGKKQERALWELSRIGQEIEHVHANDISEERVDKTDKNEHVIDKTMATRIATQLGWVPKKEWQGLTYADLYFWGGELGLGELGKGVLRAVDAHLREKNT